MNERIRELAEQANETILLDIRGDGTLDKEVIFSKEKFAELLIRECAELCAINDPEQAEILLEHFGVE